MDILNIITAISKAIRTVTLTLKPDLTFLNLVKSLLVAFYLFYYEISGNYTHNVLSYTANKQTNKQMRVKTSPRQAMAAVMKPQCCLLSDLHTYLCRWDGRFHRSVARCQRADDLRDHRPVRLQRIRQVLLSTCGAQEEYSLGLVANGSSSIQTSARSFIRLLILIVITFNFPIELVKPNDDAID